MSSDEVRAVHSVRFHENDRALVEPVCEEVASPDVGRELGGVWVVWPIFVGRESGLGGENLSDFFGKRKLFANRSGEEVLEHFKALVLMGNLGRMIGSVQNNVEVLARKWDWGS